MTISGNVVQEDTLFMADSKDPTHEFNVLWGGAAHSVNQFTFYHRKPNFAFYHTIELVILFQFRAVAARGKKCAISEDAALTRAMPALST